MRILKATFKQWGPHENLTLDMDAPVFALLGPNFAGKSNIITGFAFAFTGLLDKSRKQESYVRRVEGEDIPNGSVDVEFIKGGIRGRIFRQVGKTPSRKLWWDGATKPLTSAAEVEKLMGQILDCDRKAVEQAVFLSQGHLADFLLGTPAQREEDFAKICLIDNLGLVAEIAATEIQRLQKTVTDVTSQRDEALQSNEQAVAALRTSESELELHPDRTAELTWISQRISRQQQVLDLEAARQVNTGQVRTALEHESSIISPAVLDGRKAESGIVLEEHQAALEKARAAVAAAEVIRREQATRKRNEERITELSAQLNAALEKAPRAADLQGLVETLRTDCAAVKSYQAWQLTKDSLTTAVEAGKAHVKGVEDMVAAFAPEAQLQEHIDNTQKEIETLASEDFRLNLASSAEGHIHGSCPLCGGHDLSNLPTGAELVSLKTANAQKLTAAREVLKLAQTQLRLRDAEIAKLETYRKALAEREMSLGLHLDLVVGVPAPPFDASVLEAKLQELEILTREQSTIRVEIQGVGVFNNEIERLRGEVALIMDPTAATTALAQLDATAATVPSLQSNILAIQDYHRNTDSAHAAVVKAQSQLESYETQVTEALRALEAHNRLQPKNIIALPALLPDIQNILVDLQNRQANRERVQGMIRANTDALRRTENRVREIEERAQKNALTMTVIGHLEDLKSAFSRQGIARHYLTKVFDSLVGMTQENLAAWDSGFQVEKDPDNLFNFLFYMNERPDTLFDQNQLSGGQRTRVALSFVQAVQTLLYPGLDFLCVDEPSNHLDLEGVEGLVKLFQTLALQNADGEAQVLVVDHHPGLQRAFSKSHTLTRL